MPFKKGHKGFRKNYGKKLAGTPVKNDPDEDTLDAEDEPSQAAGDDADADGEPDETLAQDADAEGDADDLGDDELEEVDSNATPELEDGQPIRRRRVARTPLPQDDVDDSEAYGRGTPRRNRIRPKSSFRGGFARKGRARGTAAAVAAAMVRQVVDKEGNTADVVDDEVVLPEDEEGETKVDKLGVLAGNREYRVRTFKVIGRGDRLYMLSTEPARCMGFRDSYLFFNRHLQLYKVILDDEEKRDLIDREIIPHSYKGRSIGVVTARSVFREFGAKIIIGGKRITDDYEVAEARAAGVVEGELAVPEDAIPVEKTYNKNQYVAWHGASNVYHNNQPSVPVPLGKRKAHLTMGNWMFEHARQASIFNSQLAFERRKTLQGVYDPHTNLMCYPRIMQPTHARWEYVPPPTPASPSRKRKFDMINGTGAQRNGVHGSASEPPAHTDNVNGVDIVDPTLPPPEPTTTDSTALPNGTDEPAPTLPAEFAPPSTVLSRNYLVVDTCLETAPHASLPAPGLEEPDTTPLYPGGGRLPQLDEEDMASLPSECRDALLEAKAEEFKWRDKWHTQARDAWRGELRIGVGVIGI